MVEYLILWLLFRVNWEDVCFLICIRDPHYKTVLVVSHLKDLCAFERHLYLPYHIGY